MRWVLPFSCRKKWSRAIFLNRIYASGGNIFTVLIRVLKNRAFMLFVVAYHFLINEFWEFFLCNKWGK